MPTGRSNKTECNTIRYMIFQYSLEPVVDIPQAAIEYSVKNYESAKEALTDMPPRSDTELDAVTLHNQE